MKLLMHLLSTIIMSWRFHTFSYLRNNKVETFCSCSQLRFINLSNTKLLAFFTFHFINLAIKINFRMFLIKYFYDEPNLEKSNNRSEIFGAICASEWEFNFFSHCFEVFDFLICLRIITLFWSFEYPFYWISKIK